MITKNSIAFSIIVRTTVVVTLLWVAGAAVAAWNIRNELNEAFDAGLQENARRNVPLAVGYLLSQSNTGTTAQTPRLSDRDSGEYLMYQVRDQDGRVLLHSHDADNTPFPAPLARGFWQDAQHRFYTEPSVSDSLYIQVAEPLAHRLEAWAESAAALLVPLVLFIPASIFGLWIGVQRGLRPLSAIGQEIEQRGDGNLDPIISGRNPDELRPIVSAVNTLMARLQSALNAERAFAANSAHELRTPIASALAQIQRLVEELDGNTPAQNRGRKIEDALRRLAKLSEKLLQLSRAEAGAGISASRQHLGQALALVLEDFTRDRQHAGRLEYDVSAFKSLYGKIDQDAFAICMRNLLENALLHGSPDSPVTVSITDDGQVCVANDCPRLSQETLHDIKGRFRRHNPKADGSGLGLAIVESLIVGAGGRLTLLSPRPGQDSGFEARLDLP